jgi:hypothetical protein
MTTGDKGLHSAAGIVGDGWVTLLLGLVVVVAAAPALVGWGARGLAVTGVVSAIAITVIAGYNAFDLSAFGHAGDQLASMEMGHGLVMTVIGGIVALVGGARVVARS